jgi:hypothetical protein
LLMNCTVLTNFVYTLKYEFFRKLCWWIVQWSLTFLKGFFFFQKKVLSIFPCSLVVLRIKACSIYLSNLDARHLCELRRQYSYKCIFRNYADDHILVTHYLFFS